jgi:tetratricopeptide (TPR) repeat protein
MERRAANDVWVGLGLVGAVLLVYLPVICGGGFFFDDQLLLLDNRAIWADGGLWSIWFSTDHPDYFPLMSSTLWVEARLWGHAAWGYHLTNALLHGASAVLLWRILLRLRVPAAGAVIGALLFALSPVNVASVASIAERKNTLSMLLACGAVLAWLRAQDTGSRRAYAWSIVLFAGSLLSKTATVMVPVVLLVLAWQRRGRVTRRDVLRTSPFFGLSLLLGLVTVWFQHHRAIGGVVVRDDSMVSRAATAACAVWFYLGKALLPVNLMFNYPRWDVMRWGAAAFVPAVLLLALFALLGAFRKTALRPALGALGIYVLLLLPMLGFLNIFFMRYSLVSDYWQYHATAAVYGLIGAAGAWAIGKTRGAGRRAWLAAASLVVLLFAGVAASEATIYRSGESLWRDTIARNPDAWVAEAQLGMAELQAAGGDAALLADAIGHLERARALAPQEPENLLNVGAAYQRAGRTADALAAYAAAAKSPRATANDRSSAFLNQSAVFSQAGRLEEAAAAAAEALAAEPGSALAALRMADVQLRRGDAAAAQRWYEQALTLDPTLGGARYALAGIKARAGDLHGAATQVALLTGAAPDDPAVRAAVERLAREGAATRGGR